MKLGIDDLIAPDINPNELAQDSIASNVPPLRLDAASSAIVISGAEGNSSLATVPTLRSLDDGSAIENDVFPVQHAPKPISMQAGRPATIAGRRGVPDESRRYGGSLSARQAARESAMDPSRRLVERDEQFLNSARGQLGARNNNESLWPESRGGTISASIPSREGWRSRSASPSIPDWARGQTISRRYQSKLHFHDSLVEGSSALPPQSQVHMSDYEIEIHRSQLLRSVLSAVSERGSLAENALPGRHTRQRQRDRATFSSSSKKRLLEARSQPMHGNMLGLATGVQVRAPTLAALRDISIATVEGQKSRNSHKIDAFRDSVMLSSGDPDLARFSSATCHPTLSVGRIGDENEASIQVAAQVPAASSSSEGWWDRVQSELRRRRAAAAKGRTTKWAATKR